MAIELVPLCTATLTLAEPFVIPEGPAGTRVIIEVEDFVVEGDRIRARQKGKAGADWLSINSALLGTIDVRALLETDDGALIYTTYSGRLDLSESLRGSRTPGRSGGRTSYPLPACTPPP
jgi:hypothetical protein